MSAIAATRLSDTSKHGLLDFLLHLLTKKYLDGNVGAALAETRLFFLPEPLNVLLSQTISLVLLALEFGLPLGNAKSGSKALHLRHARLIVGSSEVRQMLSRWLGSSRRVDLAVLHAGFLLNLRSEHGRRLLSLSLHTLLVRVEVSDTL